MGKPQVVWLIYMFLESLKGGGAKEIFEEIMAKNLSNYESHKSTDQSLMNNKHKKHEVNNTETHHQVAHNQRYKEKNLNHLESLSVSGQI